MISSAPSNWLEGFYKNAAEWTHGRLLRNLAKSDCTVHTQLVAAARDPDIDSLIETDATVLVISQVVIKSWY